MRKPLWILAGLTAWAGLAAPAAADDIDLLNRTAPAPNIMILLDTSQSMTWYNPDGRTRGDEYGEQKVTTPPPTTWTGTWEWTGDPVPEQRVKSRMAMAKKVLSGVMNTQGSKAYFGLASYPLGNSSAANPNENVNVTSYHYFSSWDGGATRSNYRTFDWNTLANVIQAPLDSTNIYMPAKPSFTVQWRRTGDGLETYDVPPVAPYDSCDWQVAQYSPDKSTVWSGPWTESHGTPPDCAPPGQTSWMTRVITFNQKVSGDDPAPWKYDHSEAWTAGPPVEGVGLSSGTMTYAYSSNQGAGPITLYHYQYVSQGQVSHPGAGGYTLYRWHYYYAARCVLGMGCNNTTGVPSEVFTNDWATSWQSTPPTVSNPGDWYGPPYAAGTVLYDEPNYWSGNNYQIGAGGQGPSCNAAPAGWSLLVDVGPGNASSIQNYLGKDWKKELHAVDWGTPLKHSLDSARLYFTQPDGPVQTDPQKDCRGNYVILVTDGGESCPAIPTENSPAQDLAGGAGEAAANLRNASVNAKGGVITYVVGLDQGGLSPDEQNVLGAIARRGSKDGSGTWYPANDEAALQAALEDIISKILSQEYAIAGIVVPTLRRVDNLMILESSFKTPSSPPENPETPWWRGELTALKLKQSDGPDDGDIIPAPPLFQAGALLATRPWGDRQILSKLTGAPGPLVPFDASFTKDVLGVPTDAVADTLRQVVKGNNGKDFKLGDIFHSTPVVVFPSNRVYIDRTFDPAADPDLLPVIKSLADAPDTFGPYRNSGTNPQRPRIVLVGANDGMLHAFIAAEYNAGTGNHDVMVNAGKELWGFIPPQMLPKLKDLNANTGHRYFVDSSPKAADVWLDDNNDGAKAADEWHTVVVGGFRQGGTGLYALDVTNPTSPKLLWTYPTTGESWSVPVFAKVRAQVAGVGRVDRWVVVVGDGYSSAGDAGKLLHVIDIKTGKDLWQYPTTAPVAATPLLVDVNGDGYADRVYVGTLDGKLLRCDISTVARKSGGNVNPAGGVMADNWSCNIMLNAPGQTFYTAAAATRADAYIWIFIGSGDRSNPLQKPTPTENRLYGIRDPGPAITLTEGDGGGNTIQNVTTLNTFDTGLVSANGWYIKLRKSDGEKTFSEAPLVINKQVIFTTFSPVTVAGGGCGDVGASSFYTVYYRTGGGATDGAQFASGVPSDRNTDSSGYAGGVKPTLGAHGSKGRIYFTKASGGAGELNRNVPGSLTVPVYWKIVP